MHYKLGQAGVTNWGIVLLQIRANVVTNWGSSVITNCSKCCYKLGQLLLRQPLLQNGAALQIVAKCITNWGRYS